MDGWTNTNLSIFQQFFSNIVIEIPYCILTEMPQYTGNVIIHREVASIHDPHVHSSLKHNNEKCSHMYKIQKLLTKILSQTKLLIILAIHVLTQQLCNSLISGMSHVFPQIQGICIINAIKFLPLLQN